MRKDREYLIRHKGESHVFSRYSGVIPMTKKEAVESAVDDSGVIIYELVPVEPVSPCDPKEDK